jgi:hypothetical protein
MCASARLSDAVAGCCHVCLFRKLCRLSGGLLHSLMIIIDRTAAKINRRCEAMLISSPEACSRWSYISWCQQQTIDFKP